jgi:hypothetical protein
MFEHGKSKVVVFENSEVAWFTEVKETESDDWREGWKKEDEKKGAKKTKKTTMTKKAEKAGMATPSFLRKPPSKGDKENEPAYGPSSYLDVEPAFDWQRFCCNCGNHKDSKDGGDDSMTITRQTNISYEPLIRSIISKHRFFQNKRLVDYAAEIATSDATGERAVVVLILEIDAILDEEQLQQQGGRSQTQLRGLVAAVNWIDGDVKVQQWVNPPAPKRGSGGSSTSSSGSESSSGSAKKSLHQSLHLQKLARSLAKNLRKTAAADTTLLSNDAVLKGEAVQTLECDVYEFQKIVMS